MLKYGFINLETIVILKQYIINHKYRLSLNKLYGSVVKVHSILNQLALTYCALFTVLDCSLEAITQDNVSDAGQKGAK